MVVQTGRDHFGSRPVLNYRGYLIPKVLRLISCAKALCFEMLHTDNSLISMGTFNLECTVRPPERRRAAIPPQLRQGRFDSVSEREPKVFYKGMFSSTPGPSTINI